MMRPGRPKGSCYKKVMVRLTYEQFDAMEKRRNEVGVPIATQIRMGVDLYLKNLSKR